MYLTKEVKAEILRNTAKLLLTLANLKGKLLYLHTELTT